MLILNGQVAADAMALTLKTRIAKLAKPIRFGIVQVGQNVASARYIAAKKKRAEALGIVVEVIYFAPSITEKALREAIVEAAKNVTGLIVQLPLPSHLDRQRVLNTVPFEKDIDGLAAHNALITPATARGIMALLDFYHLSVKNKVVAVVGQSNLVGKPVADLCQAAGASKVYRSTRKTGLFNTAEADILIVAAGEAKLIKAHDVKPGAVVIDVGINNIADEAAMKHYLVGDVDFVNVAPLVSAISPVPGGVGPMTVIALLANLVDIAEQFSNQT